MKRGTVIGTHAAARTIRNSVLPVQANFGDKRMPGFAVIISGIHLVKILRI